MNHYMVHGVHRPHAMVESERPMRDERSECRMAVTSLATSMRDERSESRVAITSLSTASSNDDFISIERLTNIERGSCNFDATMSDAITESSDKQSQASLAASMLELNELNFEFGEQAFELHRYDEPRECHVDYGEVHREGDERAEGDERVEGDDE